MARWQFLCCHRILLVLLLMRKESMAKVIFPYGRDSIEYYIPEDRHAATLVPDLHHFIAPKAPEALVQDAFENPVGTAKLSELAQGKKKVVIIASDHTRPVPDKLIMPLMLKEIRKGNPEADITILVATGCHRGTTPEELREKFGDEIAANEKIAVHDCDDEENMVNLGKLPSGGALIINRLAVECDLLVATGFIEPHFFAGFSGGRKSVLPGICARETVLYNHNAGFIDSPCARTGVIKGNPIHEDMLFAARRANLAFICNVVLNSAKETVYAVCGDADEAHMRGREFLNTLCGVDAVPADIVISTNGGYPLDQNIYQAVKGMTAAEATVRKDGVIIMLSQCADGHGGAVFFETFKNQKNLMRMMSDFRSTKANETIVDQWQSQIFARVLMHARVIFISDAPDEMVKDLHMIPAHDLEEAVTLADAMLKEHGVERGSIAAIPDGVSVIVRAK